MIYEKEDIIYYQIFAELDKQEDAQKVETYFYNLQQDENEGWFDIVEVIP